MLHQSQTDTTLARFRTRLANARKAAKGFTQSPAWRRQAHNPACAGSVVQIHPPQPIFLTAWCNQRQTDITFTCCGILLAHTTLAWQMTWHDGLPSTIQAPRNGQRQKGRGNSVVICRRWQWAN